MKNLLHIHYRLAFIICLAVSIGLLITSFLMPPTGEIHPSVLKGAAELMFYPALAFAAKALAEGKSAKVQHGSTVVSIGDDDDLEVIDNKEDIEEDED